MRQRLPSPIKPFDPVPDRLVEVAKGLFDASAAARPGDDGPGWPSVIDLR